MKNKPQPKTRTTLEFLYSGNYDGQNYFPDFYKREREQPKEKKKK